MQEICTLSIRRRISPYFLFFLLCLFLYLPSAFLRVPFPPDEIRFLKIAKSLHTLRDFFFPKYFDSLYYDKPPLYFWILKLFLRFNLSNLLVLPILFNCFVSWGILSLNYLFFKKEGAEEVGLVSSLILATTAVFYGMNIVVRMDILFLFFLLLSFYSFLLYLKSKKMFLLIVSSLSCFLAVFTKGALGIIFPFSLAIFSGIILKNKEIVKKAFLTYSISLFLILIWLTSFSQLEKGYFKEMFYNQTLSRGFGGMGHIRSFFYYFAFFIPLFLPYSFLSLGCFSFRGGNFWEKLFFGWFIGGFFLLSFFSSKLPTYLLILAPALAVLVSRFLLEGKREKLKRWLFYISGGFLIASWFFAYFYFKIKNEFIPSTAFLLLILFVGLNVLMIRKKSIQQFRIFFLFWLIFLQVVVFFCVPMANKYFEFKEFPSISNYPCDIFREKVKIFDRKDSNVKIKAWILRG